MIRRIIFLISIALVSTWILRRFVIDTISVASGSMEPTLDVGTHYWVNRWIYKLHHPERGDIIVFTNPVDGETGYVKRVIAIEGDTIEMRAKRVILNGKPLEEPYAMYKRPHDELSGDNLGPLKVPEDSMFVLGDDRDESYDSTSWKDVKTGKPIYYVTMDKVKGRLIQIP